MEVYHFIYLVTGLIIGGVAAWIIAKLKYEKSGTSEDQLRTKELEIQLKMEVEKSETLTQSITEINDDLKKEREENLQLNNQNARLQADLKNLQEKLNTQKEEL